MRLRKPEASEKARKNACADHGEKTGHNNGKTAHRALYIAKLHGLGRSNCVRSRADSNALCDRVGDVEQTERDLRRDVAENAGYDDDRDRQRNVSAEFLAYADANGRRDGLRQECHVGEMLQPEQSRQEQHAAQAGHNACANADENGGGILFQKFKLLVEWDGETDRCRCEKIADVFCAHIIDAVINTGDQKECYGQQNRNQQRIAQRRSDAALEPDADAIRD